MELGAVHNLSPSRWPTKQVRDLRVLSSSIPDGRMGAQAVGKNFSGGDFSELIQPGPYQVGLGMGPSWQGTEPARGPGPSAEAPPLQAGRDWGSPTQP